MNKILLKIKEFITNITIKIGDKQMHALCSIIITLLFGIIFNPIVGLIVGGAAGILKELYDEFRFRKYNEGVGFDKEDIVYDLVGVLVPTLILILL